MGTSCTLPPPVLQFPIRRKDEHPFTELDIDVGKEPQDFGAGDFTDLLAEFIAALCDQILPQSLHHLDPFRGFGKLTIGRRQNAFQSDDYRIACHKRTDFVRALPQKLLFKLDNGVAERVADQVVEKLLTDAARAGGGT